MKNQNKKQYSQNYYKKNAQAIKKQRNNKKLLAKLQIYGFWLLLTAVLVDTFINQILK